jgi:hypothetical protein
MGAARMDNRAVILNSFQDLVILFTKMSIKEKKSIPDSLISKI